MDDASRPSASAKIVRRLIPFLMLCYFVAYLDRVNVGFAALTMNADLGFSARVFGLGAGIFFAGYFLFEMPSNLLLLRFGARIWIARIMVTWGLLAAGMALVAGAKSFCAIRFLLGAAEAGFFPGIILYLTWWFTAEERARWIGVFMTAIPLSSVIGGPVSGWILDRLDGALGVPGWRWLFLLEGLPSVAVGVACLARLDDGPATAAWLAPEEREALSHRLAIEDRHREASPTLTLREARSCRRACSRSRSCISGSSPATTGSAPGCRRSSRASPSRCNSTRRPASRSTRSRDISSRCPTRWPLSA